MTLKIRTGWDREHRNALNILKIAENAGVQALAMHGRTRACGYSGEAEYDTIRAVKAEAKIPVIANGDITTPEKAKFVLEYTGADAVMIGRAAQGRPWIFREIAHYLATGESPAAAGSGRNPRRAARTPPRSVRVLWRCHRRARGAQAHLLVHQGAGRQQRLPPHHEPA